MTLNRPSSLTRRTAIKLTAASAFLTSCKSSQDKPKKHVAVIGGGIVGSSIAYHLAKEGVKVTLLDKNELCTRASRGTFAWINATWAKQPRHYHSFNQSGLTGWKKVQSELGIPIKWGGSLEWFESPERQLKLAKQIEEQVAWGEPARMIDVEALQKLEPFVSFEGVERAAYSPNDGAVNPVLATQKFVQAAKAMGASIKPNCSVQQVEDLTDGGVKLVTTCGDLVVDEYVLATGANPEAPERLAGVKIPQRSTSGVIVMTKPHKALLNRILVAPGVHIHQRPDGRIILGEQDGAPDTQAHAERLRGRPNQFPSRDVAEQHAWRILAIAEQYITDIGDVEIEDVYIGWRPLPLDGHPVIGKSPAQPKAYLAIMHSGVSLAPIVGDVVAKEIALGISADELENYRPDRAFEAVKRY